MAFGDSTRGILRPRSGFEHFELDRAAAPADLSSITSGLWTVRWDLPEGEVFEQEILPFPHVNIAFEQGGLNVHGPAKARFVARLTGQGWVAGMRFRPAGFFALSVLPMSALVEQVRPAGEVLGVPSPPCPSSSEEARSLLIEHVRAALRSRTADAHKVDFAELERISECIERTLDDRTLASATDLAAQLQMSVRSLHRSLEKHVGVSSKWIIRRARIQQCADRVAHNQNVNWAEVARELGYHDQAHLIRDFKGQMGCTPQAYAEQCGRR